MVPHMIDAVARKQLPRSGSTLLHIDSHADMGKPKLLEGYHAGVALPANSCEAVAAAAINDFLLQTVHLGLVEHIIFVEPPWARQCRELHHATATLQVGEVDGALKVVVIDSGHNQSQPELLEGFWEEHDEPEGGIVQADRAMERASRARFTVVGLETAAVTLPRLIPPGTPLILDIDLDGFSTESPGAIALRDVIPDVKDLMRLYHLAYDLCDIDESYIEAIRRGKGGPIRAPCGDVLKRPHVANASVIGADLRRMARRVASKVPAGEASPISRTRVEAMAAVLERCLFPRAHAFRCV